jgi:hypothetical protein
MLETFQLLTGSMVDGVCLINIATNLYYFKNFEDAKTKITACSCIINDPDFVNKNFYSMSMFLETFNCCSKQTETKISNN